MWGVGAVFGPVVGPILGAMATEAWNWRAAFFMIVPPGIATLVCIWFALREHTSSHDAAVRLDRLYRAFRRARVRPAHLRPRAAARLVRFPRDLDLRADRRGRVLDLRRALPDGRAKPFLDPRLLLDRNFTIGILIAFVIGMLSFTSLVLFPTLLHDLRGYPENAIGTLIAARGLGNWTAFLFIMQLTRSAPSFAIGAGLAIQAAGSFWMSLVRHQRHRFQPLLEPLPDGPRQQRRLHADGRHGVLDTAAREDDRGRGRVHDDAQFRLEPVHLDGRAGVHPHDVDQLRPARRVRDALQVGAHLPGFPGSWNPETAAA